MTKLVLQHKRKLIIGLIIAAVFVGFKVFRAMPKPVQESSQSSAAEVEVTEREAALVTYGQWSPDDYRTVLGQVVSDSDVDVKAELNGTIARVNVSVGDKVSAGQALASFKTSGDATAINYQSALSNLQTTKLSTQNSVRSAEIALDNAKKSLEQTILQQDQAYEQAYETLRVDTLNSDSLTGTAIDTLDQMVQFSTKHNYNQSFAYAQIGNVDVVRRNDTRAQGRELGQAFLGLTTVAPGASENEILRQANIRRRLIEDLQAAYANLGWLLRRGTVANGTISEAEIDSFVATADSFLSSLNTSLSNLQTKIDAAKGSRENTRLATLSARNAVESAEQNLELAQAQAAASVVGAQNQVNLTGASTADLTVRAPISGTVTAKSVRVGDLVNPGTELFTIVNEQLDKKVTAYLNQDEWRQAQKAKQIDIEIDGKVITVSDVFLSTQLDSQTQKVLAEFTIPAGTTLVGNLATVRIPLGSNGTDISQLLPFSAVSFEPDGPEVLLINAEQIAERRKVIVDRVVVSNIEIISGLETGDQVVEFYKRVLPGEKIVAKQSTIVTTQEPEGAKVSDQKADEETVAAVEKTEASNMVKTDE